MARLLNNEALQRSKAHERRSPKHKSSAKNRRKGIRFDLGSLFLGGIVSALGISFAVYPQLATGLSFGWILVGLWAFGLLNIGKRRPMEIVRNWKLWAASAGLVTLLLGVLSFDDGLSGKWNHYLSGTPNGIGVLKLMAIAVVVLLLAYPKLAKRVFLSGVKPMWAGASRLKPNWVRAPKLSGGSKKVKRSVRKEFLWTLPEIDLLAKEKRAGIHLNQLGPMAETIEAVLSEYGATGAVTNTSVGPTVVRFSVEPGWAARASNHLNKEPFEHQPSRRRVKVSSILALKAELGLALHTPHLRIEPVPSESGIGLEVPNPEPWEVHLRPILESEKFRSLASKGGLPMAVGLDTSGQPVTLDLAKAPHLMIAGASGSGKSVCMETLIVSLLMSLPPSKLSLILVDPKRVGLTAFQHLPHLLHPVLVEPDDVIIGLRSLVEEMSHRYKLLEKAEVVDISDFNASGGKLARIVLVVDELSDLMLAGTPDTEKHLVRLAQLGRAAGIHLVLATQRPSVNVVTGLLKANILTRIGLSVASQVDSRVILDVSGAETLLGNGDMLLMPGNSPNPVRLQGAVVSSEEIRSVVNSYRNQKGPVKKGINSRAPSSDTRRSLQV